MEKNFVELLREEKFVGMKEAIKKSFGQYPVEDNRDEYPLYQQTFAFEVKSEFFEKVEAVVSFTYQERIQTTMMTDCQILVGGIYTEMSDRYFFAMEYEKFSSVFDEVDKVLSKLKEEKTTIVYFMNAIHSKTINFRSAALSDRNKMTLEEDYLFVMSSADFKNIYRKELMKKELENRKNNNLFEEIQAFNKQNAIDDALERKDFETLKQLTSV